MMIYNAITLNRLLLKLKISGGEITRSARVKIIDIRNKLIHIEKRALEYREEVIKQCHGEKDAQETTNEALDKYFKEKVLIEFEKITTQEFDALVEMTTLDMAEYEFINEMIVEK